eukprot:TRINITY_DN2520_c0_g2_i1.p1 TRINITY_DN2520_c0_g2~~TRINITY_DN2520_c0_g2_i1.p1  ORF type:complete len:1091 (+),score=180.00 TRINITY_DN2520_c0_g2_i1:55-3327(+)
MEGPSAVAEVLPMVETPSGYVGETSSECPPAEAAPPITCPQRNEDGSHKSDSPMTPTPVTQAPSPSDVHDPMSVDSTELTSHESPAATLVNSSEIGEVVESNKRPREEDQIGCADDDGSSSSSDSGDEGGAESDAFDSEEEVDREPAGVAGVPVDVADPDLAEKPQLPVGKVYGIWEGAPLVGTPGFNDFAAGVLKKAQNDPEPGAVPTSGCPPLQPHQAVVGRMLQPGSPISRLLVDHPTGSGKTREMITTLDNFFFDPRPKVPIFPKEAVCRNFYAELLRWPSKYRDFFCCLRPQDAGRACKTKDWRSRRHDIWTCAGLADAQMRYLCDGMREVLEMKSWFRMGRMLKTRREAFVRKFPDEKLPAAPLRALRYTSAGGRHTQLGPEGWPASALLKVAFDMDGKNVYSNKIVVMDEVHNLVRTQTLHGEQLDNLRELLFGARGMVLAGFTGTPILSEPCEGRKLLSIIKGRDAPACDEGYLSCFPQRPRELFAASLPDGVPDNVLTPIIRRQLITKVNLGGEALQRYDGKRAKGLPDRRLRAYCNLSVHFGSLHDGRGGSKARIISNFHDCAPKLHTIVRNVLECQEKALVLVHRMSGMDALLAYLRSMAKAHDPPFGVATMDELSEFNSAENLRGELYRVIVADASQCSEGVNFIAVRRVHLADVPPTPTAFVQSVGRSIRMYGHRGLAPEEQNVTTVMYAGTLPRWLRSPLGAWAYRAQKRHEAPKQAQSSARRLLRRLLSVGIKDLDSLKIRLDRFAEAAAARVGRSGAAKGPLDHGVIASFLESIGLWDEAKALRFRMTQSEQKQVNKIKKQRSQAGFPPRIVTPAISVSGTPGSQVPTAASQVPTAASVSETTAPGSQTQPSALSSSTQDNLNSQTATVPPTNGEAPEANIGPDLHAFMRRQFVGALQALHLAESTEKLIKTLHLSVKSADEDAVAELARRSREFVPALAELREKAVDRAILQKLAQETEQIESEGESSGLDFGVSDSDGDASRTQARPQEAPMLLPPGWRTETVRRKSGMCREFVDPTGRRYRTIKDARKAVNLSRGMDNMSQRLKSKYADKILKQRSDGAFSEVGTATPGAP